MPDLIYSSYRVDCANLGRKLEDFDCGNEGKLLDYDCGNLGKQLDYDCGNLGKQLDYDCGNLGKQLDFDCGNLGKQLDYGWADQGRKLDFENIGGKIVHSSETPVTNNHNCANQDKKSFNIYENTKDKFCNVDDEDWKPMMNSTVNTCHEGGNFLLYGVRNDTEVHTKLNQSQERNVKLKRSETYIKDRPSLKIPSNNNDKWSNGNGKRSDTYVKDRPSLKIPSNDKCSNGKRSDTYVKDRPSLKIPSNNNDKCSNGNGKRSDTHVKDRPSLKIPSNNNSSSNDNSRELVSNVFDANTMMTSSCEGGNVGQGDVMLGSIYEFNTEANQSESDCMFDRNDFVDTDFIIDDSDDDYCGDVNVSDVASVADLKDFTGEDRNLNQVSSNNQVYSSVNQVYGSSNGGGCSNHVTSVEFVENSLYSMVKVDGENNNLHDGYDSLENFGGVNCEDGPYANIKADFSQNMEDNGEPYANITSDISQNMEDNGGPYANITSNMEDKEGPYANITANISQTIPLSKVKVKSLINELDTESDLLLSEEIYETIYYYNKNKSSGNECLEEEEDEVLIIEREVEEGEEEDDYRMGGGEERSSTYVELMMNSGLEETDNMSVAESLVCDDELEQESAAAVKPREMLALPIGHDVVVQGLEESRIAVDVARKVSDEGLDERELVRKVNAGCLDQRGLVDLARKIDAEGLGKGRLVDFVRKIDAEGLDQRGLVDLARKIDAEELGTSRLVDFARKIEAEGLDQKGFVELARQIERLGKGRLVDAARKIDAEDLDERGLVELARKIDADELGKGRLVDAARKIDAKDLDERGLVELARKIEGLGKGRLVDVARKIDAEDLDERGLVELARKIEGLWKGRLVDVARKIVDDEDLDERGRVDFDGLDEEQLASLARQFYVKGLDHVRLARKLDDEGLDHVRLVDLARKLDDEGLDHARLVDLARRFDVEAVDHARLADLARQIDVVGDDTQHNVAIPALFLIDRTETIEEVPFVRNVVTVEKICFREQKRRSSLETDEDLLGKSYSDSILNRTNERSSKGFRFMWWKKDGDKEKLNRSSKSVNEARPVKNVHNNSVASSKDSIYGSTDLAAFESDRGNSDCEMSCPKIFVSF
ncbi:hypothetical protein LSTR_LSTR007316 [Laodelphax striatellus]|uniref:Uncharacterized protein n=1 Tax=Laodelphax striatellus TaxID=195883 RepID=A0A482WSZ0_LAOST|nr:hypothetical protein LSTR_LSTR007316 [Laodelphax striatellus]